VEDGIAERMYLVTAIFTLVALTATYTVIARINDATLHTSREITVSTFEHKVQTGIVIWKAFVEVLYCELHTTSVLQWLHVVKG